MEHYTQLTEFQRYQIYALMKAAHKQTEIVHLVGVHKSTISRELRRNGPRKQTQLVYKQDRFLLERSGFKSIA